MNHSAAANTVEIRSVLLLDDDVELGETLELALESQNFVVTVVRNGVEGLKQVMEFDFDVILCDLMMPNMPGDMFYLAVQRTKPYLCERFVFITGYAGVPKVDQFLASVGGTTLHKPVRLDDLHAAIQKVLKQPAIARVPPGGPRAVRHGRA